MRGFLGALVLGASAILGAAAGSSSQALYVELGGPGHSFPSTTKSFPWKISAFGQA